MILPGGFAHGDYLRTGAMARFSPIMSEVRAFADRGGPVLAIRVVNLEEMAALVLRHGARALGGSQEIPGGVSRDFEDPDGYVFELVELRS